MYEILTTIVLGALSGAGAGLIKYAKKASETKKISFDAPALIETAIYGLIIGGLAAWKGIPIESADAIVLAAGGAYMVQVAARALYNWGKILYAKISKKFM